MCSFHSINKDIHYKENLAFDSFLADGMVNRPVSQRRTRILTLDGPQVSISTFFHDRVVFSPDADALIFRLRSCCMILILKVVACQAWVCMKAFRETGLFSFCHLHIHFSLQMIRGITIKRQERLMIEENIQPVAAA